MYIDVYKTFSVKNGGVKRICLKINFKTREKRTEPIIQFTWREKFSFFEIEKTIYSTTTILHVNSVCCKRIFLFILEKIKNAQYFNNLIQ